uniref:DNA 3'-5' helicase n=1 Tax=Candidatus Kentrum sp. LPFa TaxID=2126335 RepID=A0A450WU17_9GAMM|nr:MAG: ATP-dependent exoDNAse (exonuclease V) beta subunit (contains helicase and exonuclease domains) [Candidatus Kentron sp. LPFa]VFK34352.1 MAG: ATP-dependent exoDNAse (exonuclease V) beta subunit (contains helicase and exonuclease domains) [Candidatus Kentron sp. LPFa]
MIPQDKHIPPPDQPLRDRALDPNHSFIVQAPAGSGKTGLLIQRYLALLAEVENPEAVVAVTFTRKAMGEMRKRVLAALESAQGEAPSAPFEQSVWALARKVAERDQALEWNIRAYPARLRIQTIDALCASIVRDLPWRSRLGGEPRILEDAEPLYREAVHRLLEKEEDALACVLESLDNDVPRFEALLVRMLARRDQWLRHLTEEMDSASRLRRMASVLERLVENALAALRASIPRDLSEEIVALAGYAGANLAATGSSSPIAALAGLDSLPGDRVEDMLPWRGVAELLLTQAGAPRSRYTKKEGFPPGKGLAADMKERALALDLSDAFRVRLHDVRELPTPVYADRQWKVLDALIIVLRLAAAALRAVFLDHGAVDFVEVSRGALAALDREPSSDSALHPGQGIRHLLVDEFQDTSHAQILLFTRLTANWRAGDGRTLFLVGDPMQSIYGFREADVGLYLRAWKQGIANIPLEPLTLSANFRSQGQLVEWSNRIFPSVFSGVDDMAGAVDFKPSVPYKEAETSPCIGIHAYRNDGGEQEAEQVVALIQAARREHPTESVAILARARSHLAAILPRLRAARIPYRGVEIAPLAHRPVIQDLLALTRALLHPGDRVAWLAVLRAPWCGLTLQDLHSLVAGEREACILDLLRDECNAPISATTSSESPNGRLDPDGRLRAERVLRVLDSALRQRGRRPLRIAVERAWIALGGPACIEADEYPDTRAFFALLGDLESENLLDGNLLTERVSRLFAIPNLAEWQVEVMTIHKAKGLEFDTVILPGLERMPRVEEKPLLAWLEQPAISGEFDLALAPMTSPGDPEDPIYRYLCHLNAARSDHETSRLLYVAITRARRRLHLLSQLQVSKDDTVLTPNRRSFLAHLWSALASEFTASLEDNAPDFDLFHADLSDARDIVSGSNRGPVPIRHLPVDWTPPEAPAPFSLPNHPLAETILAPRQAPESMEIPWPGDAARSVGTLIHRILQQLAETDTWRAEQTWRKSAAWRAALRGLGVIEDEIEPALRRVIQAIELVMEDRRWHWIIDPRHTLPRNEYPLTGIVEGRIARGVIDRTFVDTHGVRWIIDYKTGRDGEGERAEFPDREQDRYREQLTRYADLFKGMESRTTWVGLYFPLSGGWRAWEVDGSM